MRELPRALRWYLWAIYLAGAVMVVGAAASLVLVQPWSGGASLSLGAVAVFLLLAYAGERATLHVSESVALSLATPVHVAVLLLFPPPVAALIACFAALVAQGAQTDTALYKRLFNVFHPTLVVGLTALLFAGVAGPAALRPGQVVSAVPVLVVVLAAYYALDVGLMLGVLALLRGQAPWRVWWQTHRPTLLPEVATGAIGVLAAVAWEYDRFLLALVVLPALALRGAFAAIARAEAAQHVAEEAQEQAEAAVRLRDDVLHAVSHDLKSPLTTIKGQAFVVGRRAAELDTPEGRRIAEGVASIDGAATRMMRLINELLDVAQLQAGQRLVLDRRPTNLVALARTVAVERQASAERHHIHVEAAVPELVGDWDAFRIERVLDNLLANAVKYSPDGGAIRVTVSREDGPAGPRALLAVADEGLGIPAADLPNVFERFHRASNVAGRVSGTGLGLSGARHIVEQHGGTIEVASVEGAGTTVTVRLPLTD